MIRALMCRLNVGHQRLAATPAGGLRRSSPTCKHDGRKQRWIRHPGGSRPASKSVGLGAGTDRRAALLAVALVLSGCTPGTPDKSATTPVVKLAPALEAFAADASAHGATAVVFYARNGDQKELIATGAKDLVSNEKAVPSDKTWIIGAGTPMVAVSVMKLVEAGSVRLDDPVSAHLPEFTAIFPGWDKVTVRDLLDSTSGLPDYFPPLIRARTLDELQTRPLSFDERLRIAAGANLTPGPVSYFAWSATDWEVLGWLLERKHNSGLEAILAKDVFEPAGMGNTHVAAAGQPPEPMLHGYVLEGGNRRDFTRIDSVAGSADSGSFQLLKTSANSRRRSPWGGSSVRQRGRAWWRLHPFLWAASVPAGASAPAHVTSFCPGAEGRTVSNPFLLRTADSK